MSKYEILFVILIATMKITACEKDSLSVLYEKILDSIKIKSLKYGNDSIVLDKIVVANSEMDSTLNKLVSYLHKKPKMVFYVTFMASEGNLYFEVVGGFQDNVFLDFKKNGYSAYLRKETEIYGFLEYKGVKFYVLKYPPPNNPEDERIDLFFEKTEEKEIIKAKEEGEYFISTFENPMWLYEYTDNRIILLKSLNDKYSFSNSE